MMMFRRLSLSRKILVGIVPLFLLFVTISVGLHNHFQEEEMMNQARVSAETYANIIKESLVTMMVKDSRVDESFLERVNGIQEFDTVHILVNDLRLREEFLTPHSLERLTTRYKTLQPHDEVERDVLRTGQASFQRVGERFRAIVPFNATEACQKCHAVPLEYTLGATDLWISFERVSASAQGNWRRSFLIFVAFSILAITVATLMFTRYISKPIDYLVDATKAISQGKLDDSLRRVGNEGPTQDELAFLASRFDEMRESLREKIGQLDLVNKSLSERNKEVEYTLQQLRRAQEELVRSERLAVTGKMTAQLSHEINNPIHNIQSLLETSLRKLNGNATAQELISVALEEVTRMAKLTRQMLEFYRGSVVELDRVPIDMKELLMELVRTHAETLARQHALLVLEVPPMLPWVLGSSDKLKQVFLNLILNARDAMPSGGTITIGAIEIPGHIRIDVKDTGTGIPPEHINKIFDAFFTTKKEVSGVGLGLSVTYGIVQQHKGSINVQSTVGQGTTFTIQLPSTGQTDG
ncbi:MAG: sensor histidine kinase [Bacteroidota bacterium]